MGSIDTAHAVQVTVICEAVSSDEVLELGFDDGTADLDDRGDIEVAEGLYSVQTCHNVDPSNAAWTQSSINSVESVQKVQ